MVEEVVERISSPEQLYSKDLVRHLDQVIRIKERALAYLETGKPDVIQEGLKRLKSISDTQAKVYYPRYFKERLDVIVSEVQSLLSGIVGVQDESQRYKISFFLKFALNREYRRDIKYLSRVLEILNALRETNLPTLAVDEANALEGWESKSGFEELYPLVARYKVVFELEKGVVASVKGLLMELQDLTKKKEAKERAFLGWLVSHNHAHMREEETKAISLYLVMACGVSNVLVMALSVVGYVCIYKGYSVTAVFIVQSLLSAMDNLVDIAMSGAAGMLGYQAVRASWDSVRRALRLARERQERIAGHED